MAKVRRLVLDVVIPSATDIIRLTQELADRDNVGGVSSFATEFDKKVVNVKFIIEGSDIDFESIEKTISTHGGSIHSVDSVAAGREIIEDVETPQD